MNADQLAIAIAAVLISMWLGVTSYLTDVRLETYNSTGVHYPK